GHCYDFPIPNGIHPACAGPWLKPSLDYCGWDLAQGTQIVRTALLDFKNLLRGLAADAPTTSPWSTRKACSPELIGLMSSIRIRTVLKQLPKSLPPHCKSNSPEGFSCSTNQRDADRAL